MKSVFVNYTTEHFSPVIGGTIGLWLWQMCRAAAADNCRPLVVTRTCQAELYPWPHVTQVDQPSFARSRLALLARRLERKLTGWRQLGQRQYARNVADAIEEYGCDRGLLILNNDPEMGIYLRKRFPEAFLLHIFHNDTHLMRPAFLGNLQDSVDVVAAVSDSCAREVELQYALPTDSVKTIYNGVDLEAFRPIPRPPSEQPVIHFAGRLRPEKAVDVLLDAALCLSERRSDFSLQLVGGSQVADPWADAYSRGVMLQVETLRQRGIVVEMPGHVCPDQMPAWIAAADISVTPSRWAEPFGLVTLEAMACGLATIGTRTGGTPEIIGDAGMLIPPDDVKALAKALDALLSAPARRMSLGRSAREKACAFPWSRTWKQIREISGLQCSSDGACV